MISNNDFKAIAELDLDPIKVKLMHKESGEGWTLEYASAVEAEYRRFLYLMKKFPHEPAAPQFDVDIFWHYHILDTMKYAVDCEHVFGHFLHHFPYVGLRDEEDEAIHEYAGVRMRELYEATFGEPYLSAMLGSEAQRANAVVEVNQTAFSWIVDLPPPPTGMKTEYSTLAASKTAFSWIVDLPPPPTAGKTALSTKLRDTVATGAAAASAGSGNTAAMARSRRLCLDRPVLAAA
jgi:hypothetical protein